MSSRRLAKVSLHEERLDGMGHYVSYWNILDLLPCSSVVDAQGARLVNEQNIVVLYFQRVNVTSRCHAFDMDSRIRIRRVVHSCIVHTQVSIVHTGIEQCISKSMGHGECRSQPEQRKEPVFPDRLELRRYLMREISCRSLLMSQRRISELDDVLDRTDPS